MTDLGPPLLTVAQVAGHVGLSHDAIRRAVNRGDLPASKLGGRMRIKPADMEAWIDRARVVSTTVDTSLLEAPRPNLPTARPSFRERMRAAERTSK